MTTARLELPLIDPQSFTEKATVNAAFARLDALVQGTVLDRDLTDPPADPALGDAYLVPAGGTGAWAGWDGSIALWDGQAWQQAQPRTGWRLWVADERVALTYRGGAWREGFAAASPSGAQTADRVAVATVSLSGASTDTPPIIPSRALIDAVTVTITEDATGAASIDVDVADVTSGGAYGEIGTAAGTQNSGITSGVTAVFADSAVRFTAIGGAFTGGAARVAVHFRAFDAPAA